MQNDLKKKKKSTSKIKENHKMPYITIQKVNKKLK